MTRKWNSVLVRALRFIPASGLAAPLPLADLTSEKCGVVFCGVGKFLSE